MRSPLLALAFLAAACGDSARDVGIDASVCPGIPDAASPDAASPADAASPDAASPDATSPPDAHRTCGLLINGGAETGDLTGWSIDTGKFEAATVSSSRPAAREGGYFFVAGSAASSSLVQDVDVRAHAAEIDGVGLTARLSGWLRNWATDDDVASLTIEARSSDGTVLTSAETPGVDRGIWTARTISIRLPARTRTVRAVLRGERNSGKDNDAYFDDLDLCVDSDPPAAEDLLIAGPYLTYPTARGVTVSWEAMSPVLGRVAYGLTPALGTVVSATSADAHVHVRLDGLPPGAPIYYRIDDAERPGQVRRLDVPPAGSAPFHFVVWGDSQNGPDVFTGLAAKMKAIGPDLVLNVGDVVQSVSEQNFRHQLLEPLAPLFGIPVAFAPGNHDDGDDLALWDLHIAQPHCYGFRHAGVYFLVLNTDDPMPGGGNETCLDKAKADPQFTAADLRVVLFHEPPRIEYWADYYETGTAWVRETLEPVLDAAHVDVVFTGHNHLYMYGPPDLTSGVTWVTTGGGGGSIEPTFPRWKDWPEITVVIFRHHFLHLTVNGKVMHGMAIADTGEILHEFEVIGR